MRRLDAELLVVEALVQMAVNHADEEVPRDDVLLVDEPAAVDERVEWGAPFFVLEEDPSAPSSGKVSLEINKLKICKLKSKLSKIIIIK